MTPYDTRPEELLEPANNAGGNGAGGGGGRKRGGRGGGGGGVSALSAAGPVTQRGCF